MAPQRSFPLADAADFDATGPWYRAVLGLLPPNYENLLCRRLGVQSIWASPIDLLQPPAASVRVCSKISTSGSFPAADFRIALIGRMPQRLFVHLSSAPRCHDVALRRSPKLIMRSTHPPGSFCAPNLQARSMWASWAAGHQRVNHGLPLATWGLGQRLKTLPGDSRYRVSRAGFTGPHKCWLTGMAKKRDKPTELAEQGLHNVETTPPAAANPETLPTVSHKAVCRSPELFPTWAAALAKTRHS